jgi:hypothetical protein
MYISVARLFLVQHTIKGENTKRLKPNGHTIYQHCPLQDSPKNYQIGIFGLKIYAIWQP